MQGSISPKDSIIAKAETYNETTATQCTSSTSRGKQDPFPSISSSTDDAHPFSPNTIQTVEHADVTSLLKLQAPRFDVLCEGGREKLKLDLLSRWKLPTHTFDVAHFHEDLGVADSVAQGKNNISKHIDTSICVFRPCRRLITELIEWVQVWLAFDEDLYFIPQAASPSRSFVPRKMEQNHLDSTNSDSILRNNGSIISSCFFCCPRCTSSEKFSRSCERKTFHLPTISPSNRRIAIIEAKGMLQDLVKSSSSNTLSTSTVVKDKIVRNWIDLLDNELFRLVSKYIPSDIPIKESVFDRCPTELFSYTSTNGVLEYLNCPLVSVNPNIRIMRSEIGGSGVFLKSPCHISSNSILMSVKETNVINIYSALSDINFRPATQRLLFQLFCASSTHSENKSSLMEEEEKNMYDHFDSDIILMLYLIHDRYVIGTNSFHFNYYSNIPSIEDEANVNLMLAPPEVVEFMDVPEVQTEVETLISELFNIFQWLKKTIFQDFPSIFDANVFTWDRFLWSRWLIDTRGFALNTPPPKNEFEVLNIDNSFYEKEKTIAQLNNDVIIQEYSNSKLLRDEYKVNANSNIGGSDSLLDLVPPVLSLNQLQSSEKPTISWAKVNSIDNMWKVQIRGHKIDDIIVIPKRITNVIPGIDMFNHHPVGHCRPPKFDYKTRRFVIRNEVPLYCNGVSQHFQQLFMSYGPCETWQLMLHYGFCPSPMEKEYQNCYNEDNGGAVAEVIDKDLADNIKVEHPVLDTITLEFNSKLDDNNKTNEELIKLKKSSGVSSIHILRDPNVCQPSLSPQLFEFLELSLESTQHLAADENSPIRELARDRIVELLERLLDPIIEKLVMLQFWEQEESMQPHWFGDWHQRLQNFFECRRNFLFSHIKMLSSEELV